MIDIERLRELASGAGEAGSIPVPGDELETLLDRLEAAERERDVLARIGMQIATQDNRITDQPMFVVFQKREIVVDGDYDHDRIAWIGDEGHEPDEEVVAHLNTIRKDIDSAHFMENEIELIDDDGCRESWRYLALKEVDEFVTACFTEQGCKDYLKADGHNLTRPFIYAAGSYRNREYQQVRNLMLSLAKEAWS